MVGALAGSDKAVVSVSGPLNNYEKPKDVKISLAGAVDLMWRVMENITRSCMMDPSLRIRPVLRLERLYLGMDSMIRV